MNKRIYHSGAGDLSTLKLSHKFCLASLLCFASSAMADNFSTPDQFINSLLEASKTKCLDIESSGKKAPKNDEAYRAVRFTFCQCYPDRARMLKNSMPKSIQEKPISEKEFIRSYLSEIVNGCAKEQAKSQFGGDCPDQFSKVKPNSAKYCSCMANYINGISDAEAAQLGLESAKYIPLLAEANKRELPPPNMPTAFKNFMAMDSICTLK